MGPSGTCRGWQSSVWMVGVNWGVGSWWWKVTTHLLLSLFPLRSTVLYILINYSTFCSEKVYYHLARFSGFDKLHLKNTLTGHFCTISTLTCADACQWIFPTFPPCFITLIDHSLSGQSVRSHAQSTLQLKVPRHILTYMSKLYPSDGWVTTHRRWFGIWQCGLYEVKAQGTITTAQQHSVCADFVFSLKYPFCSCSASGISFFPAATIFGSSNVASFHSPVHDGSVDVDEIDEDSKVEDALDADEASLRLVATK